MSINSLTNAAAGRRPDTLPKDDVPKDFGDIAAAANSPPTNTQPAAGSTLADKKNSVETTLNVLFGYIPTEVITLYVTVISTIETGDKATLAEWIAFVAFVVSTPMVVWLVYAAKLKAAGKQLPLSFGALPVWEMLAATIAFVAWSFALPRSPFGAFDWYSPELSGVIVLIVSTFLGLLAPFFQRPLKE
jgi:hypothetical protein